MGNAHIDKQEDRKTQNITPTPTVKIEKPTSNKYERIEFDNESNDLVAALSLDLNDKNSIILKLDSTLGFSRVNLGDDDTNLNYANDKYQITNQTYLETVFKPYNQVVAWNSKGTTLAVAIPNKIYIYNLKVQEKTRFDNNDKPFQYQDISLVNKQILNHNLMPTTIFFLGDDKHLVLNHKEIFNLTDETKQIITLNSNSKLTEKIYPINKLYAYAYWEEVSNNEQFIILNNNGKQSKYAFIKPVVDGLNKIMFSENLQNVCVETQTSGYSGFTLLRTTNNNLIELEKGPQYSNCVKWLDANTILVSVNSYFHQNLMEYYTFDFASNKLQKFMSYKLK